MDINSKNMCANEIRKAAILITRASEDNMDISGYGCIDVNQSSGNVYLWLEDERSCLYIGLDGTDNIHYCRTCNNCGYEDDDVSRDKMDDDMICPECKEAM